MPIQSLALSRDPDGAGYWVSQTGGYTPFACADQFGEAFGIEYSDLTEVIVCWSKDQADVPPEVDAVKMLIYCVVDDSPYLEITRADGWIVNTFVIGQYVALELFLRQIVKRDGVGVQWAWLKLPKKAGTAHAW